MTVTTNHADSLRAIEAQLALCLELADDLQEYVVGAQICSAHQTTLARLNDLARDVSSLKAVRTCCSK
ncbi:hypothetical protein [Sphingomonas sp. Leaf38]|jgi:hypothetical protein|uniref:hypothetical protein n=1 Tax=Sphingomonas sp. Leaf38 TaxID=1736217 RepID=UPI0006F84CA1|nr:hypothetical protein [Sphingomonas sp. Leaf38]KQN32702.1 hypothetical protein ASE88_01505 [Sphingomonas sp. Leaf38]